MAHQAPPSMGFSRQEYWSGLPFPSPLNIFRTWKIPSLTSGSTLRRSHPDKASSVEFSSVTQACLTLCNPMDCSMPAFTVLHQLPEFKLTFIKSVMPSNHLILCHPLLLPSVFPSIRVFSIESVLHIRWPNYWSSASASALPMNIQD